MTDLSTYFQFTKLQFKLVSICSGTQMYEKRITFELLFSNVFITVNMDLLMQQHKYANISEEVQLRNK